MDFLFNSKEENEKEKQQEKETDKSLEIAKFVLPVLVYIPIIIFLTLMGSFFGVKIYKYISNGGGIAAFMESNIEKIFSIKDGINKFIVKTVNTFWPDKDTIVEGAKSWKHVRLDSALVLTGSLFILTMIIIYNYDYIKSLMFSKVNDGIKAAKNKINKGKYKINNTGALISIGDSNNNIGKINKVYYKYDENKTVTSTEQLWYLNQPIVSTSINNDYRKVKNEDKIQKDRQYYYLYDVEINGKIIKKFNHQQLQGFCDADGYISKGTILDRDTEQLDVSRNAFTEIKAREFETNGAPKIQDPTKFKDFLKGGDDDDPVIFQKNQAHTDITAATEATEATKIRIKSKANVYDHNIFNIYDTNTSVDFITKHLKFVNQKTGDDTIDIDNWEAQLTIPKKSGVLLRKWGKKGYKKGVYSLATNGKHSGFTLGIQGNGSDKNDPLNNYIFKDKNGKTYQAKLSDYGVKNFGSDNYIPGFTIRYLIRINKNHKHDVEIFIDNNFVMKIENEGVRLNDIKWCGERENRTVAQVDGTDSVKDDNSNVGNYYVKTDVKCDEKNPDLKKWTENNEKYCLPKACDNGMDYYNLFSRQCEKCPPGTEINTDSEGIKTFFPIKDDCLPMCTEENEYYDSVLDKCVTTTTAKKMVTLKMFDIVYTITSGITMTGDIIEIDLSHNDFVNQISHKDAFIQVLKKNDITNYKGKISINIPKAADDADAAAANADWLKEDDKVYDISYNVVGADEIKLTNITYMDERAMVRHYQNIYPDGKDPDGGVIKGLGTKLFEIKNNSDTLDFNAGFAEMLDGMEDIKNKLIEQGGYPVGGNKFIAKPSFMPTLTVYQTEIIDTRKKNGYARPMQKEETGIHNKFFNSFAPFAWFTVKRNVSDKMPDMSGRGMAKRNSTLIGGIALLFGFVIFTSLLVNQFNKEVMESKPEELKNIFINKTSYYTYSIIFIGVALFLFALLLFYAATSEAGSKFLSIILIALSAVIILASITVIFQKKINEFISKNPYIKFIYHALFVIPCLFIDLVNYLYFEFKSSPRIVFIIFAIEISIILSLILLPALRNRMYIYISNESGKKEKITMQIDNLKNKKIKLERAIENIKKFKPMRDPLVKIDLNTVNGITTKKITQNEKSGIFEEEITPQNTDVIGIVTKFLTDKKDTIKNLAKNINPFADTPIISTGLNESAWEKIKIENLDKDIKENQLKALLFSYGYKNANECDKILNKKKSDFCKKTLSTMVKHIQMNASNILLFNTVIGEIEDQIENLEKIKSKSGGPLQKGTVALNKPMYFRMQKFIPIKKFNESQVEQLKYNYAVSCWFFVHSQSPNYSHNYTKKTKIISYNGEPTIYYNGKNNELIIESKKVKKDASNDSSLKKALAFIKVKELELEKIMEDIEKEKKESELNKVPGVKIKIDTYKILSLEKKKYDIEKEILSKKSEMDDANNDMVLIYKKPKFKLQKWHNLVINYVGGVIDIFLNGELVTSVDNMVSYKAFNSLEVGDENAVGTSGIGGGICNVVYYPTYISKSRIKTNYNYFKDKNPPTI